MDDTFNKLVEFFNRFPGTGPRQAKRFVFFLLSQDKNTLQKFSKHIEKLKEQVVQCNECMRYFEKEKTANVLICKICDSTKEKSTLLIVEKDQDLENIHKTNTYHGKYFVLGGLLPILHKEPEKKIRQKELLKYTDGGSFNEIIVALSASPEGDYTSDYLKKILSKNKITIFGRGLSTGTELEYSDADTIKNALENRA